VKFTGLVAKATWHRDKDRALFGVVRVRTSVNFSCGFERINEKENAYDRIWYSNQAVEKTERGDITIV